MSEESLIGRTVAGKYAVEALLGSGAMGQVYRARQIALEKTIALKVMHASIARDPAFAERFHREARAASRLDHPSSIHIIDFGEEPDGLTYIAMEYVEGRDLHEIILKERPLAPARIVDILVQALGALAKAHEMGVIHRDLKPENFMIMKGESEDGRPTDVVKVCDFGIAKLTASGEASGAGAANTTAGLIIGTPEYLSPEQSKGEAIDPRADLYAMGVILYELLTGAVPFTADNAVGILLKHVIEEPRPPSSINPAIDRRLEAICLKAMRKAKEDRYQTAKEMRADLRAITDASYAAPSGGVLPITTDGAAATIPMERPSDRDVLEEPAPEPRVQARTAHRPSRRSSSWRQWLLFGTMGAAAVMAYRLVLPLLRRGPAPAVASSAEPTGHFDPGSAGADPSRPQAGPAPAADTGDVTFPNAGPPTGGRPAAGPVDASRGVATVKITSVSGATADAVRAALPVASYRDCYQEELRQTKARLEGHAELKVAFLPSGFFSSAQGLASPELSKVGQCCAEATLRTPHAVDGVARAGGAAEVTIVYSVQ